MSIFQRGITIKKTVKTDIIVCVEAPNEETAERLITEHMERLCQEAKGNCRGDEHIGFDGHVDEWSAGNYRVDGMARDDYSNMEQYLPGPNIDLTKEKAQ